MWLRWLEQLSQEHNHSFGRVVSMLLSLPHYWVLVHKYLPSVTPDGWSSVHYKTHVGDKRLKLAIVKANLYVMDILKPPQASPVSINLAGAVVCILI